MKRLNTSGASLWAALRLHVFVLTWRHGLVGPVALAVWLLVSMWTLYHQQIDARETAEWRARLQQVDTQIRQLRTQAQASAVAPQDPVSELRHVLNASADAPGGSTVESASVVAQVMQHHGLTWQSTDYKASHDKASGLHRVQMQITLMAPYPQVRRLVEDLLRRLPHASVDAVNASREQIDQAHPTTRITLSFWGVTP